MRERERDESANGLFRCCWSSACARLCKRNGIGVASNVWKVRKEVGCMYGWLRDVDWGCARESDVCLWRMWRDFIGWLTNAQSNRRCGEFDFHAEGFSISKIYAFSAEQFEFNRISKFVEQFLESRKTFKSILHKQTISERFRERKSKCRDEQAKSTCKHTSKWEKYVKRDARRPTASPVIRQEIQLCKSPIDWSGRV